MHLARSAAWASILVLGGSRTAAQSVIIRNTTPSVVVAHLKAHLVSQGFALKSANDKVAMFTLDRGPIAQNSSRVLVVDIVLEVQFRFKAKSEGLSVVATEEAVGNRGRPAEFRRAVDSAHDSLQRLLDATRAEIDSGAPPADSSAKRDSSPP
jgi:hypothetical protein